MDSRPEQVRPAEAAPAPAPAADPAVTRISERSPKDMAISLLVLLVPIVLLLAFNRFVLDGEEPTVVDPGPAIALAQSAGAFPVDRAVGLDPAWRPVRADFQRGEDGATLRVGYLAPGDGRVQLVQSDIPAERLLPTELAEGIRAEGVREVSGRQWQRLPGRPGERALVLLEPERTVIVVGSAQEQQLVELVTALRPQ